MKICLVADTLPGYHETWSGAEMVCVRLGQMLQKANHDVVFITKSFKKKNVSEEIFQIPSPLGKISKFIPIFPYFSSNFPLDVYSILRSITLLKKIKPDVIHFHSKRLFLPLMIASLFLKIPTVLTVLDYFVICPRNNLLKPDGQICTEFQGANCYECLATSERPIKRIVEESIPICMKKLFSLWRAKIFDYFITKLDSIVSLTETSKNRLRQYGLSGKRIEVIYHYQLNHKIDEIKSRTVSFKQPTILFVGTLCKHKGLHILIQSMPYIISELPNVKLIVVGPLGHIHYKTAIENSISDLGLWKYVTLFDHKENQEVLELIAKSDVVVVPEQWLSDFGPVILIEAMYLGKPIVASRIGSAPEFIKDGVNGFLAEPYQPRQFAEKITQILQNRELAKSIGENAKASESISFLHNDLSGEISRLYEELKNKSSWNSSVRFSMRQK